jgi:hypothetical protein
MLNYTGAADVRGKQCRVLLHCAFTTELYHVAWVSNKGQQSYNNVFFQYWYEDRQTDRQKTGSSIYEVTYAGRLFYQLQRLQGLISTESQ